MTYLEAVEYRKKNLHLKEKSSGGFKILGVFIYPREPELWHEFLQKFHERKYESVETAKLFSSNDYGLMAYFRPYEGDYAYKELSSFSPEYEVVLPDGY